MLCTGMYFDCAHGTQIHANMDREIHDEVGQVDVAIAPKFFGVFAEQRHKAHCPLEEATRKNLIVKSQRLERRTSLGVERGVIRFFESKRCRLLNMNVIRMFISTDG